jgi:hypothetical protein
MKNKLIRTVSLIGLLLIFIALIFSCQKNQEKLQINYDVSLNEVENIAKKLAATEKFIDNNQDLFLKAKINDRPIDNIFVISDERNTPAIYVINYSPVGFALISATKKELPILAYSNSNSFDIEYIPDGILEWIDFRKRKIHYLKNNTLEIPIEIITEWESYDGHPDWEDPNDGDPPLPEDIVVDHFMNINWGQEFPYNQELEDIGCIKEDLMGKPPVGCLAVAMGQVMKYYEHPSIYNWSNMVNPTTDVQLLLKDIGDAVQMEYYCSNSFASTENEAASSFINDFGYSNTAIFIDEYNINTRNLIKNELDNLRPVLIRGGEYDPFYGYINGHAWVCEGYRTDTEDSYLDFYMNWGYDGLGNAWYSFDNFYLNDGNYSTFNYYVGVVIGIKP